MNYNEYSSKFHKHSIYANKLKITNNIILNNDEHNFSKNSISNIKHKFIKPEELLNMELNVNLFKHKVNDIKKYLGIDNNKNYKNNFSTPLKYKSKFHDYEKFKLKNNDIKLFTNLKDESVENFSIESKSISDLTLNNIRFIDDNENISNNDKKDYHNKLSDCNPSMINLIESFNFTGNETKTQLKNKNISHIKNISSK